MADLIKILEQAERSCLQEYEQRRASFVWVKSAPHWKSKAEGIRYAIDTILGLREQPEPKQPDADTA